MFSGRRPDLGAHCKLLSLFDLSVLRSILHSSAWLRSKASSGIHSALLSQADISFRVNRRGKKRTKRRASGADKIRLEKYFIPSVISSSHTQREADEKNEIRRNFASKEWQKCFCCYSIGMLFANFTGCLRTLRILREELRAREIRERNSHKITMGNLKDIERITKSCISSFVSTSYTHTSYTFSLLHCSIHILCIMALTQ